MVQKVLPPIAERVRELLSYNEINGEFRHRLARKGVRLHSLAGTISGTDGLRYIGVDGRKYAAQRLAWLYIKGKWPEKDVGFCDPSLPSPMREKFENLAMVAVGELTPTELRTVLSYDPATGIFIYRSSRKGVTAGKRAGSIDPVNGYRFIGIRDVFYSAQRLAWFYHYGEWPDSDVRFRNGERDDCRIENLFQAVGTQSAPELRRMVDFADRRANPEKYALAELRRNFGPGVAALYDVLLKEQRGVCIVCGEPELSRRNGKLKALAIDHNHESGIIRGLMCSNCNPMIGYAKEQPARLRAAADLLEIIEALFEKQNGKCAVCSKGHLQLLVDRSAEGGYRGLVCLNCKAAMVAFGDDSEKMNRAAEFLLRYRRVPGSTVEQNLWEQIPSGDTPDNIVPLRKDAS